MGAKWLHAVVARGGLRGVFGYGAVALLWLLLCAPAGYGVVACGGADGRADGGADGGEDGGAEGEVDEAGGVQSRIIYGADDRIEAREIRVEPYRSLARKSVAALVPVFAFEGPEGGAQRLACPSMNSVVPVCPDERFARQPSCAFCSATLIAPDLVLTAGHCVASGYDCGSTAVVFDYLVDADGKVESLEAHDVYRCKEIVTQYNDYAVDYAVIRIERSATPRYVPARYDTAKRAVVADEKLGVIGFPVGLPMKADLNVRVESARAGTRDYFTAATDVYGGNSGSGVFRDDGAVVGIIARGPFDWQVVDGECLSSAVLPDRVGYEEIVYASRAIDALCAAVPEEPLCRTGDPCADGACDAGQSEAGVGIPEIDVDAVGDPLVSGVPDGWTCRIGAFASRDGCDCDCGAWDPDCDWSQSEVYCDGLPSDTSQCLRPGRCLPKTFEDERPSIEDEPASAAEYEPRWNPGGDDEGCAVATTRGAVVAAGSAGGDGSDGGEWAKMVVHFALFAGVAGLWLVGVRRIGVRRRRCARGQGA